MKLNISGAVLAYVTNDLEPNSKVHRKYNDVTQKLVTTRKLYIRSSCSTMYPKLRKPQSEIQVKRTNPEAIRSRNDKFNMYNNNIDEFLTRVYRESLNLIKYIQIDIEHDVDTALRHGFKVFETSEHNDKSIKICEENDCLFKIADVANNILKKVITAKADAKIKHNLYKTVDTVKSYHYEYICKHYNVCRSKPATFVEYCKVYLDLLTDVKNDMLKQFFLTLAETLHKFKIETIMNEYQRERIKYHFVVISTEAEINLRNRIAFLYSILSGNAKEVVPPTEYRLYKGLVNICDENFVITEPWHKVLSTFTSWTKGQRIDLKYIILTALKYLNKELTKWNTESVKDFNSNVNYLMGAAEEDDVDINLNKTIHK